MIWAFLALLAGAMLPIQAGVNAELARLVGQPVRSALISFAVGTGALLLLAFALTGPSWPWGRMRTLPFWKSWPKGAGGGSTGRPRPRSFPASS